MAGTIYSIQQTDLRDKSEVTRVAEVSLPGSYTSMFTMTVAGKLLLVGYNRADENTADTYEMTDADPWVARVANRLNLVGPPWDVLDPFFLGVGFFRVEIVVLGLGRAPSPLRDHASDQKQDQNTCTAIHDHR